MILKNQSQRKNEILDRGFITYYFALLFMALSTNDRGKLEKIIDHVISEAGNYVKACRQPEIKKGLMIQREEDFVLGWSLGTVVSDFSNYFFQANRRMITLDELFEVVKIVIMRIREIRDEIYKAG